MAYAAKKGKIPMGKLKKSSKQMTKMTGKQLKHFFKKDTTKECFESKLSGALGISEILSEGKIEIELDGVKVAVEYEMAAKQHSPFITEDDEDEIVITSACDENELEIELTNSQQKNVIEHIKENL